MIDYARVVCVTCVRGPRTLTGHYRDFLLDPSTLFTLASFLLLIAAVIQDPSGLNEASQASTPLYLAAALVGSAYIWWSAIQGIRERDFTADIPVSLATIAAIAIGQYSAAAVVAVLLLAGAMLEDFVSARAVNALDALAKLLPDQVTVRRDGRDVEIPLDQIRVGDVLLVRSGERVSADGEVIGGNASVNQAAITGESVPVERRVGDSVFVGTLNEVGVLEVRVTRIGEETNLGQIRRIGLLVLEDGLRPEAKGVAERLARMGIRTVLVTGDNRATAERIAKELGIAEVHAEVFPAEKVAIVKSLQSEGRRVAFVGDGVNDGPALATADVGIAMGRGGTDVAIETAEIALLSDDLEKLPHLITLSRKAVTTIKQNLVFSLGVLVIAVSLATVGILAPVTGALLHELSSIPVIANSARLIGAKENA